MFEVLLLFSHVSWFWVKYENGQGKQMRRIKQEVVVVYVIAFLGFLDYYYYYYYYYFNDADNNSTMRI
jgi:hypothetical protein